GARAVEAVDAGSARNEDRIGPADEEAALDGADDAPDAPLQPCGVGNGIERAIENAVTAVGHERLARGREAQPYAGAERLEACLRRLQPESRDLDGNRRVRAQPIRQPGLVDD